MIRSIEKDYKKLCKLYDKIGVLTNSLRNNVQKICDFEVDITYCQGDGVLILEPSSAMVVSFTVLDNKNRRNKLTINDVHKNSI